MNLIRILIIGLIVYWILRLLGLFGPKNKPRVRKGRSKPEVDRFKEADIEEVSYTELPPDAATKNESAAASSPAEDSDNNKPQV